MIDALSLDQLRVFLGIVDHGSFSEAARRLGRAQSAISYAIASLEEALGVAVFDRSGWRPHLTEAGIALVADARAVLGKVDLIKARAQAFKQGVEPEVRIATDVMFSNRTVVELLRIFRNQFPAVAIKIGVEALGEVTRLVLDGEYRLGIACSASEMPEGLQCRPLRAVPIKVVVAKEHPLAKLGSVIDEEILAEHVQISMAQDNPFFGRQLRLVSTAQQLRTADIGWKYAMVKAGLGWGFMPEESIQDDVEAGRLIVLGFKDRPQHKLEMPVSLIFRAGDVLGPASSWVAESLASELK